MALAKSPRGKKRIDQHRWLPLRIAGAVFAAIWLAWQAISCSTQQSQLEQIRHPPAPETVSFSMTVSPVP